MNIQQQKVCKMSKQKSLQKDQYLENENIPSFLMKTYEILENNKFSDIISWTKNGEGFIVKKVKEFSDTVLPVYFRHNNYTSFVRQLNMYDFHKTRQQNQQNAFKNFMFKKGHKYLLKDITRKDYKKIKENNKQLYTSITDKLKVGNEPIKQGEQPPVSIKASKQQTFCSPIKLNTQLADNMKTMISLPSNYTPLNQCFRGNLNDLKKTKDQLQEQSLKLMCFKEEKFTSQMILKAIEVLFQCGIANKKAFGQMQLLRTDFELNRRKTNFTNLKSKCQQDQKRAVNCQNILATVQKNIQAQRPVSSGFKEFGVTDTKTALFNSSQPKDTHQKFSKLGITQISLFGSFKE